MAVYNIDSKLSDTIMSHPSLIPVVNRLGVTLGVGDHTIGRICGQLHIHPDFFLSIVNTFIDEEYFPVNATDTFSEELTVDYLRKTAMYYRRVQLPNIDRHFKSLIERSGSDNNLPLLQKFYSEMKGQLEWCLDNEENQLFHQSGRIVNSEKTVTVAAMISDGYREAEERLHDLLTFFVVHLRGDYDRNLCTAVVSAVFSLEKDIRQNNRIRDRILVPLIENKC